MFLDPPQRIGQGSCLVGRSGPAPRRPLDAV